MSLLYPLLFAALLAGPVAASAAPLDTLLEIKDPKTCTVAAPFKRLLDSIFVTYQRGASTVLTVGKLDVPAERAAQIGRPTLRRDAEFYVVTVPLRGSWRGLPVRALVAYAVAEGDATGFRIEFAASRAAVLAAANAAGFALPPTGGRIVGDELTTWIGVRGGAARSEFYCSTG